MSESTPFGWWPRRVQAALLVAEDEISDVEIAKAVGVSLAALKKWKREPAFKERVGEHRAAWAAEIKRKGIADRRNRVEAANDRHRRLQRVIDERARDAAMIGIPGGETGLLVAEPILVKMYDAVGQGDDEVLTPTKRSLLVKKYAVDVAPLAEMRQIEKQIAQDLGQWTEKQEHTGEILVRRYEGVQVEDV